VRRSFYGRKKESLISVAEISALLQVIFVDLILAGDNAIVVGMVAAGLPVADRKKIIFAGIVAATVMRILFALITVQLLQIVGLVLAGGLLLLWVCWRLWRDIDERRKRGPLDPLARADVETRPTKTMRQAVVQIVIADISMSLDNVLAVAGIAREHTWVLVVGLVLSVAFMGLAAAIIAHLLERYHWVAYIGLIVIFYVAVSMILDGTGDLVLSAPVP
jgi:YjbE family integral membrane protein